MAKRRSGQPIRVLVVDCLGSQRELLSGLLRAGGMEVAGAVGDGYAAVAEARRLRPDVIAMDVQMPGQDGYAATRQIMQACPTPIVLTSSANDQQHLPAALAAGALTVVRKPGSATNPGQADARAGFVRTVRLMADVLVVTRRPEPRVAGILQSAAPPVVGEGARAGDTPLILAIAASTGGPAAVQTLLSGLGRDFPLPILLAQHIASGFATSLAEWLGSATRLPVHITLPNERLRVGHVYLAPDGQHLSVFMRDYAACRSLRTGERYCPSADVLFESVAAVYGRGAIGIILTGMGDDGARGLHMLRAAGGRTLAQDQASCVVNGMPQAAVDIGAVERVAAPAELARTVCDLIRVSGDGTAL